MDVRIFPEGDVVPRLGTIEEVGDSTLTFLAKKPRSQRRTRMIIPLKDIAWYVAGGSKFENHPDILYMRPTSWRREPATQYKNVEVVDGEELRTFSAGNRSVVVVNEDLVRVSCEEDVSTEAEKKKQPKAARARKKPASKSGKARTGRKRRGSDDEFGE